MQSDIEGYKTLAVAVINQALIDKHSANKNVVENGSYVINLNNLIKKDATDFIESDCLDIWCAVASSFGAETNPSKIRSRDKELTRLGYKLKVNSGFLEVYDKSAYLVYRAPFSDFSTANSEQPSKMIGGIRFEDGVFSKSLYSKIRKKGIDSGCKLWSLS